MTPSNFPRSRRLPTTPTTIATSLPRSAIRQRKPSSWRLENSISFDPLRMNICADEVVNAALYPSTVGESEKARIAAEAAALELGTGELHILQLACYPGKGRSAGHDCVDQIRSRAEFFFRPHITGRPGATSARPEALTVLASACPGRSRSASCPLRAPCLSLTAIANPFSSR